MGFQKLVGPLFTHPGRKYAAYGGGGVKRGSERGYNRPNNVHAAIVKGQTADPTACSGVLVRDKAH